MYRFPVEINVQSFFSSPVIHFSFLEFSASDQLLLERSLEQLLLAPPREDRCADRIAPRWRPLRLINIKKMCVLSAPATSPSWAHHLSRSGWAIPGCAGASAAIASRCACLEICRSLRSHIRGPRASYFFRLTTATTPANDRTISPHRTRSAASKRFSRSAAVGKRGSASTRRS